MIEKIKKGLYYVALPAVLLIGAIVYIVSKFNSLKDALARTKQERNLADVLARKDEATKEADDRERDYIDALKRYKDES